MICIYLHPRCAEVTSVCILVLFGAAYTIIP